ncbi:hypothetical protein JG687_00008234 [Phytophthora cactorum]|uniref:Uncharacterized protein n=1 Tax=Phytophthora cactorum TaxID=29920 RepID=A0A8T1UEI7_9STRA|nr:hypothetical protein JG687_00008234 [Phytophthora cactorum]
MTASKVSSLPAVSVSSSVVLGHMAQRVSVRDDGPVGNFALRFSSPLREFDPFYAPARDRKIGKREKVCRHSIVNCEESLQELCPSSLFWSDLLAIAGLGSRENSSIRTRRWMCVYLAPRWRRRSSPLQAVLVLALALLLTAIDGRTLRSLGTGSTSTSINQQEVGVVTTDTQQSTTTVTTRAWKSGSYSASQFGDEKSVSFDSLVKTTTAPTERSTEQSKEASSSTDHEIQSPCSSKDKSSDAKQGYNDHDEDGSFNDYEKDESDQSYQTSSAKALENKTKSASLVTENRSFDQTLVVVIVGVVGAIGALLMFVSRKVLKETGDDQDLEDSSIF